MNAERWREVDTILQQVLERAPGDRTAFLDRTCAGRTSLRAQVESLIRAYEQGGDFLDLPVLRSASNIDAKKASVSIAGQTLGHYEVKGLLGSGGMGEVYLAEDKRLGRRVAIKLLSPEFTSDAEAVRRFAQEARAASALNHPNIITIYEIDDLENAHYIVTEYIEGETLRQRMDRGPLKLEESLDLAIQIGTALEAAHQAGIIHRDIKPENVMVRPDRYVKVLDFGLAKLLEPSIATNPTAQRWTGLHTETGLVMGTPRCMSPEQVRGEKADNRTDIFSLGIVLYEMVAGQSPFRGATRNDVIAAILKDEPPSIANEAPAELGRIVERALRKSREERYQTVQHLLSDLKRLKHESSESQVVDSQHSKVVGCAIRAGNNNAS